MDACIEIAAGLGISVPTNLSLVETVKYCLANVDREDICDFLIIAIETGDIESVNTILREVDTNNVDDQLWMSYVLEDRVIPSEMKHYLIRFSHHFLEEDCTDEDYDYARTLYSDDTLKNRAGCWMVFGSR